MTISTGTRPKNSDRTGPDRTDRYTGLTGLPVFYRSTGFLSVYQFFAGLPIFTGLSFLFFRFYYRHTCDVVVGLNCIMSSIFILLVCFFFIRFFLTQSTIQDLNGRKKISLSFEKFLRSSHAKVAFVTQYTTLHKRLLCANLFKIL